MEKQERKARMVLLLGFIQTLIAIGLLAASIGSDDWVNADILDMSYTTPVGDPGYANHGLFRGQFVTPKSLLKQGTTNIQLNCSGQARICRYDAVDPATGATIPPSQKYEQSVKLSEICVSEKHSQESLDRPAEISFWLWISTLIFLSLALLFALVTGLATLVNVIYVPVSDIAGLQGVYVWNTLACIFSLVTVSLWVALYYSHLQYNILPSVAIGQAMSTCQQARHGSALWMCVVAIILFALNIVLIRLRRGLPRLRKDRRPVVYTKGRDVTLY